MIFLEGFVYAEVCGKRRKCSWCYDRIPYVSEDFRGHAVALLVEALCYKQEGRGFESSIMWIYFNLPNPSSRIMALGSTQPLREMSTRNFPWA
jgi:hypothetical protein